MKTFLTILFSAIAAALAASIVTVTLLSSNNIAIQIGGSENKIEQKIEQKQPVQPPTYQTPTRQPSTPTAQAAPETENTINSVPVEPPVSRAVPSQRRQYQRTQFDEGEYEEPNPQPVYVYQPPQVQSTPRPIWVSEPAFQHVDQGQRESYESPVVRRQGYSNSGSSAYASSTVDGGSMSTSTMVTGNGSARATATSSSGTSTSSASSTVTYYPQD